MAERKDPKEDTHDYLETLERVQKQYEQYVEVAELYKLPIQRQTGKPRYASPSVDQPLTVNSFRVNE